MNKALAIRVHSIAEEVRHWAEELARKRGHGADYDLNGFCAIASVELFKRLKKEEITAELRLASSWDGSHVYIVVEDYIVDVTATQFSEMRNRAVVIQHEKELEHLWYYTASHVFVEPKKLRKSQIEWGWPQDQIAFAR
jgi:hypothetical protein